MQNQNAPLKLPSIEGSDLIDSIILLKYRLWVVMPEYFHGVLEILDHDFNLFGFLLSD
ncbi:MAG: hypothetical protein WC782_00015 [Methylococcaceae bacterium]|jgi:hypothetical protein